MTLALESIDPTAVPRRTLYTGAQIPAIGLGTFGSDHITSQQVATAVKDAIGVGYRHIDCASVYGNEKQIGDVFKSVISSGIERDDLWVTSKLWNDMHASEDVIASCKRSLEDLQLEYLDLYLVHWPFPNFHPAGCDVSSRSADAMPYIHANYMKTWRAMETLVDQGLVRHIGTSNMTIPKLKLVLEDARIKPAVNEMELHPHFQQSALFDFVTANQILPIGYSPIGSPGRPQRDRTAEDTVDTQDPVIVRIANRLGVHPAVVCIKWAIQRGQVPIPFSTTPRNYVSNLKAAITEPLTDQDMTDISQIDRNCRLIKGQVFLWKDNQSWEDLWDLEDRVTPA
ncbi:MAG TPA: aldo/keto reductase [Phycisphaerales bacterium]|nr:aldo/keto reductase [Phycisphaerales bacterium]HCD35142.1 aldo/keto reductase [Phycisphaerales bacterium]|tara:strand:+ start:1053 stop:2075 length:1023 start_codon:yes stop_codon:yes gene_type:complete